MKSCKRNKGFTLVELIIVIALLGVLMAVLIPQYIQYVEKSKEAVVKQEAANVQRAMQIAYTEVLSANADRFQWQCTIGTKAIDAETTTAFNKKVVCDRVKNFWFAKTVEEKYKQQGAYLLADAIKQILGIDKDPDLSTMPISSTTPASDNSGTKMSMDNKLQFQILFDKNGNIATEYCRNGYFVRIEGGTVTSVKLKNENDSRFTKLSVKGYVYK